MRGVDLSNNIFTQEKKEKNMKRITFLVLFGICMVITAYAGGRAEQTVELTIENKTGTHITQIVVTELDSTGKVVGTPSTFNRSIKDNESTQIKLKRGTLYGIVLVDTDERQYAKKRLAWDEKTATISFIKRDILDRNIWDKAKRVILWPTYL